MSESFETYQVRITGAVNTYSDHGLHQPTTAAPRNPPVSFPIFMVGLSPSSARSHNANHHSTTSSHSILSTGGYEHTVPRPASFLLFIKLAIVNQRTEPDMLNQAVIL